MRHFVMTNDVNWTNDGHMFAWRMMLNQEACESAERAMLATPFTFSVGHIASLVRT
jgi:hypothetical protein